MFLTVTNLQLNPISYVISGDYFKLFWRPKITENQVLKIRLTSKVFQSGKYSVKQVSESGLPPYPFVPSAEWPLDKRDIWNQKKHDSPDRENTNYQIESGSYIFYIQRSKFVK